MQQKQGRLAASVQVVADFPRLTTWTGVTVTSLVIALALGGWSAVALIGAIAIVWGVVWAAALL